MLNSTTANKLSAPLGLVATALARAACSTSAAVPAADLADALSVAE